MGEGVGEPSVFQHQNFREKEGEKQKKKNKAKQIETAGKFLVGRTLISRGG